MMQKRFADERTKVFKVIRLSIMKGRCRTKVERGSLVDESVTQKGLSG